jgi:sugar lactone lactonase YvrE
MRQRVVIRARHVPGMENCCFLKTLWSGLLLALAVLGLAFPSMLSAQTGGPAAATVTTLAITAAGQAATTVTSGTVVTLTADVTVNGAPLSPGMVIFCDATAQLCENSAIVGTARLTAAGTATLSFVPGVGSHSYKAVFAGTTNVATSTSAAQPLTVSGTYPTATTIAASGTPGNYTLTGTVVGTGPYAQTSVFVIPNQPYTDTGIAVTAGQAIAISATGEMDWYTGGCTSGCTNGPNGSNPCPEVSAIAPNLVCYSLIGTIGTNGTPFQVGASLNIASPATGELYLGVNDGYFADNTLGWTAFVDVSPTPTGSVSFIDQTNGNMVLGTAPLSAGTPAQTLVAATGSPLTAGTAPYAVATGDFNGDGFTDFAVENYNSDTVSVFLGNGDGTFKPQVTYPVGTLPEGIAAADVNGDGKLDLLVTNTGGGTVGVLLSNGDGTFQAQVTYATGAGPTGIVVGDFNNDGKLDIATSNYYGNDVSILLGNGGGTFQTAVGYAVGNEPRTLTSGDFNGDGNIDVAVANENDNTVSILFGTGSGTFQAQILYPTGTSPQGLAVADFNGDGIPDLAIGNSADNTVGIMLGAASGVFGNMTVYNAGKGALGPVVADFNGDGNADIAVENFNDGTESLFLGNGDGTFQAQATFPTGTNPYAAAVGNFNGDGYPDLAISNFGSNNETILLDQITTTTTAVLTPVAVTGAAGNHHVVATYPGDANFATSTSTPVALLPAVSAPTITTISPPGAYAGSASLTVTISGTQFLTGAAVAVNGTSQAATFVSATQLTTTLTAAQLSTAVTLTLVVVNPDGGTSNAATFTVTAPAVSPPTITSLSPSSAYVGSGATVVTITGTQFITGAAVTVNGTSQSATFVSATQLTTTLTAEQLANVGTLTLVVIDPDGGTSNAAAFTVLQLPLQLAPPNLAFGNQTVGTPSAPQVVTVTNSTAAAINITTIILDLGLNPGDFTQTNNCPATIAAGASCQITITFTPSGVGAKSAGLAVSDSTSLPNESVGLTGTGTGGILQVNPGNLKTIAGNGTAGYVGDGGAATAAELNTPDGVNFDAAGNLYIADVVNNVIRKVDTAGKITTVAGNGTGGFSGDGGPATAAELHGPFGVTPDAAGNLYIQDTLNARIRRVDAATGIITTIAGNGTFGLSGDGGPATAAEVAEVQGARFDAAGNLYVAQCGPAAIRKIDTAGTITTVAGTGTDGFSGDGGPATSAQLNCASGVAIDAAGELFIADYLNNRIRKVDATGVITTIAGNGTPGFTGDGGPAAAAEINLPNDVDLDTAGDVYIADSGNNRVRKIATTGAITTVAGGLDNAGSAGVNAPSALAFDTAGYLYFSDAGNNAVREVFAAGALAFPATSIGVAATALTVTLSNIGNLPVAIAAQASFGLSGNAADFSLVGGSCLTGATLAANGGSCTLQIGFTPTASGTRTLTVSITDDAVYSPQTFSISGVGTTALPVVLSSITPTGAQAGAGNTTITATGANFSSTSIVNFNSTPLVTTFVSATQLTAVVPAALLTTAGGASVTVTDSASDSTSQPEVFSIVPGLTVTFTGPGTTEPGQQPTLNFTLAQAYPAALSGTMTMTFAPNSGYPDDPQVQFATGGRSFTFTLPANTTDTPVVSIQAGTVAGTITISLQLTTNGVDVTPPNLAPITIIVPKAAPSISAVSFSVSGNTLTVLVTGYSSTREIQSAAFFFTPASGASLSQKTITVPSTALFTTWYTSAGSAQYGSSFTYTQLFTLSGPANAVGGVGVTLTNTVGVSSEKISQ